MHGPKCSILFAELLKHYPRLSNDRHPAITWAALATSALLFYWTAIPLLANIDQDAWIYFNYYLRFFERPFSYQPGHVAFGATSPLHVVMVAPIFHLLGASWLPVAKLTNFALVLAGCVLAHRASRASASLLPLLVAVCVCFDTLMQATATLFETGLVCFLVSLLLYSLERRHMRTTIATAALLHLARPELILVSATALVVVALQERRLQLGRWAIAFIPVVAYYFYMWASGAGLVPTSVVGRAILGVEFSATWGEKFAAMVGNAHVTIYLLGLVGVLGALAVEPRRGALALIVIAPIATLYTVFPPGYSYLASRYLVPLIPGLIFCLAIVLERVRPTAFGIVGAHRTRFAPLAVAVVSVLGALAITIRYAPHEPRFVAYSPDTILQKDLAEAVSGLVRPGDRTLMYEIQGQYHFPGYGVSADGIVGREAHDFLLKRQTFDDFVQREHVAFIVTFNAFNYRRIYAGSPLVDLYTHDLRSKVGDELCVGRFCYRKLVTNPYFSDDYIELPASDLNVGTTLRYYGGRSDPGLKGQLIQWNSVYRIRQQPADVSGRSLKFPFACSDVRTTTNATS